MFLMRFREAGFLGLFCLIIIATTNYSRLEEVFDPEPQPPGDAIEQLALDTTMTRSAQRLFYRQNPQIEPRQEFYMTCSKVVEQGVTLGCYKKRGMTGQISIQQVTDRRLAGIMEVTAAHEMLHAAYELLSSGERDELASRLVKASSRVKDQRLINVLNNYRERDIELYHNELHSHLGTELANLGDPQLEQHYQRYFRDRQQIVAFADKSRRTIRQLDEQAEALKPQIDALETRLKQIKPELDQAEAELKASSAELERLQAQLEQTKTEAEAAFSQNNTAANQLVANFDQQKAEYNRQVSIHNQRVERQKERVANFNVEVDDYEQKIDRYNAAAREERTILDGLKSESQKRLDQITDIKNK
jgi:chromosome segregation ATPase